MFVNGCGCQAGDTSSGAGHAQILTKWSIKKASDVVLTDVVNNLIYNVATIFNPAHNSEHKQISSLHLQDIYNLTSTGSQDHTPWASADLNLAHRSQEASLGLGVCWGRLWLALFQMYMYFPLFFFAIFFCFVTYWLLYLQMAQVRRSLADVKFVSLKCKGLNNPIKRSKVLHYLRHLAHIIFLQETHLKDMDNVRLRKTWIGKIYHSSFKVLLFLCIEVSSLFMLGQSLILLAGLWDTLSMEKWLSPMLSVPCLFQTGFLNATGPVHIWFNRRRGL